MYTTELHPWIHIFIITHEIGREMDISINVNKDTNDNLCRHSSEPRNLISPPGPPPLQSSIQWQAHKDKGMLGKHH